MSDYNAILDAQAPAQPAERPSDRLLADWQQQRTSAYDALLDNEQRKQGQLAGSLKIATATDPDSAAQAVKLSRSSGLPVDMVERNQQDIARRERIRELQQIAVESPVLYRQLTDPYFAKLAHDDAGHLSVVERIGRQFVGSAAENVGRSLHGFGELANVAQRRALSAFADVFLPAPMAGGRPTEESLAGPLVGQDASQIGKTTMTYYRDNIMLPQARQTFADQVVGGLGQVASQIVMLPIDRGASLYAQGASIMSEKVEKDDAPQWKKDLAIAGGAAVTGITEKYALDRLLAPLPANVRNKLGAAIGRIIVGGAAEGGQEIAESIGHDALQILLTNPEAKVDMAQAMQEGGVGFTVGAIVRSVVESALHAKARNRSPQQRAADTQQNLADLVDQTAAAKLTQRDAETMARFLGDATGSADTFVDARQLAATFAQSGIRIESALPSIAQQITTAAEVGGDVAIPTAELALAIAQNPDLRPLIDHARSDPSDPTPAEARAWQESGAAASFEQEAGAVVDHVVTAADQAATAAPEAAAALQQVFDDVLGQLNTAGRFTPEVNKQYATLTRQFFEVLGQRTGIDIKTLADQYMPAIVNRGLGAQALTQPAGPVDPSAPAAESQAQAIPTPGEVEGRQRGAFDPSTNTISLLSGADLSSFLHESGHFYLETLIDIASRDGAPIQVKHDAAVLMQWFGVQDLQAWQNMSLDEKRPHHEAFARGFEAYLFEGNAPAISLRPTFARFRAWLVRVYKSLAALDVQLSDDVRQVFDRLIASDSEIEQAKELRNARPLYRTKPEHMTEVEWLAYQDMAEGAENEALAKLQEKKLASIKARRTREGKAAYKAVRQQVAEEVMRRPVYAARQYLSSGTLPDGTKAGDPVKLDLPTLKQIYGEGADAIWRDLPLGRYGMASAHNGVHPDVVAEQFGFSSGDALVRELVSAPRAEEIIKREAEERFAQQHGDDFSAEGIRRAAEEELANEPRAQQLTSELNALRRATGMQSVLHKATKDYAAKAIGQMPVKRARQHMPHVAAEVRAGKLAEGAFAIGDMRTAASAKFDQVLNHQIARAATQAREEVAAFFDRTRDYFVADSKLAKTRDMDLVNATRAILAAHGLGTSDKAPLAYVELIRKNDPDTWADIEPMINEAMLSGQSWKDMTLDEFRAMADTVESLWHLSRRTRQIEIDGQLRDREEVATELANAAKKRGQDFADLGKHQALTASDKRTFTFLGIRSALRRVESWAASIDGGKAGAFRRYLWTPIREAADQYRDAKRETLGRYLDIVKGIEPSLVQGKIEAPEIGYTFRDKGELLHAVLHTGNESNRRKLLLGRGWGTLKEDGTVDHRRWGTFIRRAIGDGIIGKADFDFAQSVWDLLESMKPAAQEAHKAMYGRYFDEITADPLVTPFGTYRGGYVPAVADAAIVTDAAVHREAEAIGQGNIGMFPSTGRGFTKGRVDYNKPLLLDLSYLPAHIDKVLKFTHLEQKIRDAARIVKNSKTFAPAMDALDPTARTDLLLPWLQRAASQRVDTPATGRAGQAADRFFRALRNRTGLAIMTGNVVNTLQQITGLSSAAVQVRPMYLRNALWQYVKQPKATAEAIVEKSAFMRNRITAGAMEVQTHIDDMLTNPSAYEKARDFAQKHGYFMQAGFQNVVDTITWSGAYEQAVAQGVVEEAAIRQADSAVRETQGSFAPEDVSRFETGSPFVRAFTQFYSYFNTQSNLLGTEFANTVRDMGLKEGAGRIVYLYFFGMIIPAALADAIVRAMGQGWDDDKDGEVELWEVFLAFFGSQVRYLAAMAPGVGPALAAGFNTFNDKPYDDRISTSPAVSTIEATVRAPHSVYKAIAEDGKASKAIRDTLTAVSLMTGIPVTVVGRPLGYAADMAQGYADPENPVDMARGLISGRHPKD